MIILKFIEKAIIRFNVVIMLLSLLTMIVLGAIQIILRNFFNSGFTWADIIIRTLVLWVGFSGAVVATSKGRHIAIGVLIKFIPPGWKRAANSLISAFTGITCAVLTYSSTRFVWLELEGGNVLFGNVPIWISELIIPVTFFSLAYQFVVMAFEETPRAGD